MYKGNAGDSGNPVSEKQDGGNIIGVAGSEGTAPEKPDGGENFETGSYSFDGIKRENKKLNAWLAAAAVLYALCFAGLFALTIILTGGFELYEVFLFAFAFAVAVSEFFALLLGRTHLGIRLFQLFNKEARWPAVAGNILAVTVSFGILAIVLLL